MVLGHLRGASQCLTGGVQSSRGGGGVGWDGGGMPLPSLWVVVAYQGHKGSYRPYRSGWRGLWNCRCRRKEAPASSSPCRKTPQARYLHIQCLGPTTWLRLTNSCPSLFPSRGALIEFVRGYLLSPSFYSQRTLLHLVTLVPFCWQLSFLYSCLFYHPLPF